LFIALCKQIESQPFEGTKYKVWRSQRHNDGSELDGWFIMGIGSKKGEQITYHLPIARWEETHFAETHAFAPYEFDGHTPADVLDRIKKL